MANGTQSIGSVAKRRFPTFYAQPTRVAIRTQTDFSAKSELNPPEDLPLVSTRAGTSLLEAVLAVALLGSLVLFTIPVVHGSRAASEHAIADIETAVLAEHMTNMVRVDRQSSDPRLNGKNSGGDFDPPFRGFHWRVEPKARDAPDGIVAVSVFSTNASTTLVAFR